MTSKWTTHHGQDMAGINSILSIYRWSSTVCPCCLVLFYYSYSREQQDKKVTRWYLTPLLLRFCRSRLYYVDQVPVIKQFVRSPSLSRLPFFSNVFASSADDVDSFCRTHTCIICLYLIDDDHNKMCLSVDGEGGDCTGRDRERGAEKGQQITESIN